MITGLWYKFSRFSSPGDSHYQFIIGEVEQVLSRQELNMHNAPNLFVSSLGRPPGDIAELPDSQVGYSGIDGMGLNTSQLIQQDVSLAYRISYPSCLQLQYPESLRLHSCSQNWQDFGQIAPKVEYVNHHPKLSCQTQ